MGYASAAEWRASWDGELGTWRDKKATRDAMKSFDALGGTELDRSWTLWRIASCCMHAMRYAPESDPGANYRARIADERKRIESLRRAAHVLASACETGDRAMVWVLPGGANALAEKLSRPHDGQSAPVLAMGAAWFRELESNLAGKLPELDGGPFFHRFTIGNLTFDKPISAGRPVEIVSMLAFEIEFYLRMFTAGRSGDSWQAGQRMPTDGRPCHQVAANFCKATLKKTELKGGQVADRLRKLRMRGGVGLIPWTYADELKKNTPE